MERIESTTPDLTDELVEKIAQLMPDVMTEATDADGNVVRAIDFDALRDNLTGTVVEGRRERYQFTWPGKARAKLEARTPTSKMMRPVPERSVDWDTTGNLYIEGDNLEALKIMRETYAGKVKLIYIDPPYNTGHDFIYDDDFAETRAEYAKKSGEYDEEGGRLVQNTESNGKFHSDWCSMIYPRLLLARDLLSQQGLIFISIDVHELTNMKKICDEVFGEASLKNIIAVRRGIKNVQAQFDDIQSLSQGHEYILMYSKTPTTRLPKLSQKHGGKPGKWDTFWRGTDRPTMRYELFGITPKTGQWRWAKDRTDEAKANYEAYLKQEKDGLSLDEYYIEHYMATNEKLNFVRLNEEGVVQYYVPPSEGKLLSDNWMDLTLAGNATEFFDTEKNVLLLERMVSWLTRADDIVLDFFSGSGTMAEAVMKQNVLDGGSRKFIMVQIPESCENNPAAIDAGFETICDLGEYRIRHAANLIQENLNGSNVQLNLGEGAGNQPDLGFRVLSVDESVLRDVRASADKTSQMSLLDLVDNMEETAEPLDLLFQVLPKFRIEYSARIEERVRDGHTLFFVNAQEGLTQLIACFDETVPTSTIEAIAREKPMYAVFRDASFADDSAVANLEELFKTFSPDTIRRVV